MPTIDLERRADGVRVLRLVDPDRRNAIGSAMRDELAAAVSDVGADAEARVLVITGAGSAFCSGGDLPELLGPPGRPTDDVRSDLLPLYDSFLGVRRLRVPTIAAVHGAAVGAGVNLALACDLRIMGPAGFLDVSFTRIGLHPGGGCTAFLVEAVGRQRALEIILRARRLEADECVRLGLAIEVAPDAEVAAVGLATHLARLDPGLVRDVVQTVAVATDGDFAATLEVEASAQAASFARSPETLIPRRTRPARRPTRRRSP